MSEAPNNQIHRLPKKLLKRIRECEKQLDNLKTLPYYTLFKQQAEQQKDIAAVMKKLEKLREEYSVYSRSLQKSSPPAPLRKRGEPETNTELLAKLKQ